MLVYFILLGLSSNLLLSFHSVPCTNFFGASDVVVPLPILCRPRKTITRRKMNISLGAYDMVCHEEEKKIMMMMMMTQQKKMKNRKDEGLTLNNAGGRPNHDLLVHLKNTYKEDASAILSKWMSSVRRKKVESA